jgi:hypothetical protein
MTVHVVLHEDGVTAMKISVLKMARFLDESLLVEA